MLRRRCAEQDDDQNGDLLRQSVARDCYAYGRNPKGWYTLFMKTAIRNQIDTALRDEWLQTVTDLKNKIKTWIQEEAGWSFEKTGEQKEIEEAPLGIYTVEVWRIKTPEGEVRWEPIARNYPSQGRVELYAWPTAYRVHLMRDEGQGNWRILTDSGIYLRQPWDREHFITLVRDLIGADSMIAAA